MVKIVVYRVTVTLKLTTDIIVHILNNLILNCEIKNAITHLQIFKKKKLKIENLVVL